MEELESLSFEEGSNLKIIADHAFRDCKKLKSIELPDSVYSVGISAFRGCEGLKKIEFSEKIKDEPGIKELPEILNGVELIIRNILLKIILKNIFQNLIVKLKMKNIKLHL